MAEVTDTAAATDRKASADRRPSAVRKSPSVRAKASTTAEPKKIDAEVEPIPALDEEKRRSTVQIDEKSVGGFSERQSTVSQTQQNDDSTCGCKEKLDAKLSGEKCGCDGAAMGSCDCAEKMEKIRAEMDSAGGCGCETKLDEMIEKLNRARGDTKDQECQCGGSEDSSRNEETCMKAEENSKDEQI